ncbi:hypothetical protein DL766_009284 [Monosporascus sp. MC13-8B]|uniref:Uncharacterized protein n=1 Tax=Monosporascus cannonballus TaxID=155416 RepID=A0ABY0H2N2_9PEZI|nr:hypothetical protein DL762_007759 [Monosporascus cannonballus]RYO93630.1 hypothetical protein DL763_004305 [Monosporascus cannonballus]RYP15879.1 hypothetical protein DL766_009284 [Monosporascus sp. MC13-8B]
MPLEFDPESVRLSRSPSGEASLDDEKVAYATRALPESLLAAVKEFRRRPEDKIGFVSTTMSDPAFVIDLQLSTEKKRELGSRNYRYVDVKAPVTILVTADDLRINQRPSVVLDSLAKYAIDGLWPFLAPHVRARFGSEGPTTEFFETLHKDAEEILDLLEGMLSDVPGIEIPMEGTDDETLCVVDSIDDAISDETAQHVERLVRVLEEIFVVHGKGKIIFFADGDCKAMKYLKHPENVVRINWCDEDESGDNSGGECCGNE